MSTTPTKSTMFLSLDDFIQYWMDAVRKLYLLIACFLTDCPFKGACELSKDLLMLDRCQWHLQSEFRRCRWHRQSLQYRCQRHREVGIILFFTGQCQPHRQSMTSPVSTTHDFTGVNDTSEVWSDTELIRYRTLHISNFSYTELFIYRTFQTPNFSDTELFRYRTYQILNLSDIKLLVFSLVEHWSTQDRTPGVFAGHHDLGGG